LFGANYIAVIFTFTYAGKLLNGKLNGSDYDHLTFALIVGAIFMVFYFKDRVFLEIKECLIQQTNTKGLKLKERIPLSL